MAGEGTCDLGEAAGVLAVGGVGAGGELMEGTLGGGAVIVGGAAATGGGVETVVGGVAMVVGGKAID